MSLKRRRIDILVTPAVTIIVGVGCAMVLAPIFKTICDSLGTFIGWATNLQPFFMGIIISVVVGVVLTLPISSAAICAAVGISGGAVIAGSSRWQYFYGSVEWSCACRRSSNSRLLLIYAWICCNQLPG